MTIAIATNQPLFENQNEITQTIARFWDQISEGWRMVWGPHIHHGFYENNQKLNPLAAQEQLIERLANRLSIQPHDRILDVGCGMGGSSLYLAKNYLADVLGITLSPKQMLIATNEAQKNGIHPIDFRIENALLMTTIQDQSFDMVWSLESCEQFYDKKLFLKQANRVLKPGGKLMLATWCSDREIYYGKQAKKYHKLCKAFDLPYMPSMDYYTECLSEHFTIQAMHDWSSQVKQSWDIGIQLTQAFSFLKILKIAGWRGLRFTRQIKLMRDGFREGRVRYGVFFAIKK